MVATTVCFTSVVACVTNVPALRASHSVQLQSKGDCTGQSCANEVVFDTSQSPQIFLKKHLSLGQKGELLAEIMLGAG